MPLISCPDCGNNVSDQAQVCRHCGRPIKGAVHLKSIANEPEFNFFDEKETAALQSKIQENEKTKIHKLETFIEENKKEKSYKESMIKIRNGLLLGAVAIAIFYLKRTLF
jgi:transcription initiation factor TFIIIB Brf1 subunit/transcription initiation factor TFIIB